MILAKDWLPDVRHTPSPNCDPRPKDSQVDLLVIHNISLPPGCFEGDAIEDFFLNRLNTEAHPYFAQIAQLKVSAHFLVRRDGQVQQFVSMLERAWHAGVSSFSGRERCNDFSIGIELEGTDDCDFDDRQYQALATLTRQIRERFPAISKERITGHSDIAPQRKTDPGPCFDWQRYLAAL